MERDKKEQQIQWQKTGGGTFYLKPPAGSPAKRGRKIKSGQIFKAYPSEIPQAFRDNIKALDPVPPPPEEEILEVDEGEYTLKSRGAGGWYDILDSEGKVVNEKALKKDAALEHIESLQA